MKWFRRTRSRLGGVSRLALGLLLATPLVASSQQTGPVGRPAGDWQVEHWMNSPPLRLADLRGRVVLVRWWTGPGCPYCMATAPALRELDRDYGERGLQVVGFYHHKSRAALRVAEVERLASELGFTFPVAIDPEWKTLRDWWLDSHGSGWTSVTFLIDTRGVIRYVHPGGQFTSGSPEYQRIRNLIELLLDGNETEPANPADHAG